MKRFRAFLRRGNFFIWTSGAALALGLLMILGLLGLIGAQALGAFWPAPLVQARTAEGLVLGEISAREAATAEHGERLQFRVGNRDFYGQDFRWIPKEEIQAVEHPSEAVVVERMEGGQFIGFLGGLSREGLPLANGDLDSLQAEAAALASRLRELEKDQVGRLNTRLEDLRFERAAREAKGASTQDLEAQEAELRTRFQTLQDHSAALRKDAEALKLTLRTVDGQEKEVALADLVRIVRPNSLGFFGKLKVHLSRSWEFVAGDPRESNTEGGVFPAIFGTVLMVMLMSILGVPLGVMAALYLREYAKDGPVLRLVRVAVNNLAGVPSIVFGVFGLGFFVYGLGSSIDALFYADRLPAPTFGTGGILWASLTLALLTVPVVIVATEEAIAAVPRTQREASLALGATKWQTIRSVVLPGAMPGILTGLILAMARGAGEVAPLMITGVVKLAPSMPLDGVFPYLHLDRKFMHLGFHIYDVGFQSPNSEAARPMVFMTALLLLAVVVALNLFALALRNRLRSRLHASAF